MKKYGSFVKKLKFHLLGLLTAFPLGSFHALSPGHMKTMVAAYLVGTRGGIQRRDHHDPWRCYCFACIDASWHPHLLSLVICRKILFLGKGLVPLRRITFSRSLGMLDIRR